MRALRWGVRAPRRAIDIAAADDKTALGQERQLCHEIVATCLRVGVSDISDRERPVTAAPWFAMAVNMTAKIMTFLLFPLHTPTLWFHFFL